MPGRAATGRCWSCPPRTRRRRGPSSCSAGCCWWRGSALTRARTSRARSAQPTPTAPANWPNAISAAGSDPDPPRSARSAVPVPRDGSPGPAGGYGEVVEAPIRSDRDRRLMRYWDRQAGAYDRRMAFAERRFFADTRRWLCGQAAGDTLEVAIGTGLNLPHYPGDVRLTGVEWSEGMLAEARRRAARLGRPVDLRWGDARALDFEDGRFDTVVCTFALCGIPDEAAALGEMARVLRPGGLLLL